MIMSWASIFQTVDNDPKAALIKLSDRLHNSSTLYTFPMKMRKYLRERRSCF